MKKEDAITVASHIGFAIATMNAFATKPGVSKEQVDAAMFRLGEAQDLVGSLIDASPDDTHQQEEKP